MDKAIAGCTAEEVEEIRSLGKTPVFLAHRDPGAPRHRRLEWPYRGFEPMCEKVKRCGHGFRTLEHYRLRVLLHVGGVA